MALVIRVVTASALTLLLTAAGLGCEVPGDLDEASPADATEEQAWKRRPRDAGVKDSAATTDAGAGVDAGSSAEGGAGTDAGSSSDAGSIAGPCLSAPSACGLPDATNTGARGTLTVVQGDVTLATAGAVFENKDVRGCIRVTAPNVTIRNVKATCGGFYVIDYAPSGAGTLTIEDTTVVCTNPRATGIGEAQLAVRRVDVSSCENGFDIDRNALIEDSYCHDLTPESGATADAHTDCVQGIMTNDVVIRHNSLLAPYYATSAIEGDCGSCSNVRTGWVVEGNLLNGGGYPLYCATRSSESGSIVRNNRFGPGGWNAPAYATGCTDTAWSGNVRDATGAPLAAQ